MVVRKEDPEVTCTCAAQESVPTLALAGLQLSLAAWTLVITGDWTFPRTWPSRKPAPTCAGGGLSPLSGSGQALTPSDSEERAGGCTGIDFQSCCPGQAPRGLQAAGQGQLGGVWASVVLDSLPERGSPGPKQPQRRELVGGWARPLPFGALRRRAFSLTRVPTQRHEHHARVAACLAPRSR